MATYNSYAWPATPVGGYGMTPYPQQQQFIAGPNGGVANPNYVPPNWEYKAAAGRLGNMWQIAPQVRRFYEQNQFTPTQFSGMVGQGVRDVNAMFGNASDSYAKLLASFNANTGASTAAGVAAQNAYYSTPQAQQQFAAMMQSYNQALRNQGGYSPEELAAINRVRTESGANQWGSLLGADREVYLRRALLADNAAYRLQQQAALQNAVNGINVNANPFSQGYSLAGQGGLATLQAGLGNVLSDQARLGYGALLGNIGMNNQNQVLERLSALAFPQYTIYGGGGSGGGSTGWSQGPTGRIGLRDVTPQWNTGGREAYLPSTPTWAVR